MTTAFKIDGPLPSSTLLLEASAGTGKTFTIAGLAVRYIAELGLGIDELLIITFSNNAAAELRSRVFATIGTCIRLLTDYCAGNPIPRDEKLAPLASHIAALGHVEEAIARLHAALDHFDRATICTIHKFCQMALHELGILGDADQAEELSDAKQLMLECAADRYVAMYACKPQPPFDAKRALELATSACKSTLELAPSASEEANFCASVRDTFAQRKRDLGIITFDDLITRMRDVLRDQVTGPAAQAWLRHAYAVVLVDEFQDTDPQQWIVIRDAFIAEDRPTILIGDPKQSIYGFRNADLMSYMEAASLAQRQTLDMNYRSDQGVVDGVVELMQGIAMGHEDIQVRPVQTCHEARLELDVPERIWVRQAPGGNAESLVLDDLIAQIDALLGRPLIDSDGGKRAVTASDIAVLVRVSALAKAVTARLNELGYPAVLFGASSVWDQPAARDWTLFLRALSPDADSAARLVALTDLVGMDVCEVATPEGATRLVGMVRRAQQALHDDGPSAALDVVREETSLEARLLPAPGGERYVADLLHIGELLDDAGHRDTVALLRYVEDKTSKDNDADIRLVTDSPAIRVMTLHSAKGLEFPIVLLPDMSSLRHFPQFPFNVVLQSERKLWVRREQKGTEVSNIAVRQAREEELRLLYVGLTRAKHLAIAWHTDQRDAARGALSAVMFHDHQQLQLSDSYPWQSPRRFTPRLVRIESVPNEQVAPRNTHSIPQPELHVAQSSRHIDQHWRRTSYTGLTLGLHEVPSGGDEPDTGEELLVDTALTAAAVMGPLPAGAAFGTLVHESLEVLDWAPLGRRQRLESIVDTMAVTFTPEQRTMLVEGLEAVVTTPLLPLTEQSLSVIPVRLRLPELDFDLPMGSASPGTVGALADLMTAYLPADDPLADYPELLATSPASGQVLTGMLTGSIDAVLQTDAGTFLVVDYKTNRLAPSACEVLTLGHYTHQAMAHAMMAAHYPLQAILYSAALHRYLAVRLPDYSPHRHLGGIGYLFVRGMAGPETPIIDGHPCGVFSWHPPAELVVAVSDLLGGKHA